MAIFNANITNFKLSMKLLRFFEDISRDINIT